MGGWGRGWGEGLKLVFFFFKESKSKKNCFVGGGVGEGARGSDFFLTKYPNQKKNIFFVLGGGGGGGGRGGRGRRGVWGVGG